MVTNWVVGANGEINIGTVETRRPTSPVRAVLVPKVAVESEYGSVGATREGLGGARAAPLTSMPSTIFSLRALFTGLFRRFGIKWAGWDATYNTIEPETSVLDKSPIEDWDASRRVEADLEEATASQRTCPDTGPDIDFH